MKLRVIKEHPITKGLFPLGFETTAEKVYTKEDKHSEGFYTSHNTIIIESPIRRVSSSPPVWVAPSLVPQGTFIGLSIASNKGNFVDSDWFYRNTGKGFTEFFEKI